MRPRRCVNWGHVPYLFALGIVCLAPRANAQQATVERATDQGHVLVGGGLGAFWSNDESGVPWPHLAQWSAHAEPSATYFLRDRVGLGFTLGGLLRRERFGDGTYELQSRQYQAWAGILGVFELPLGARVGLIAVPQLSYARVWSRWKLGERDFDLANAPGRNLQERSLLASQATRFDAHLLRASLFLPFVFHASPSIVLGFGPELWYDHVLSREPGGDWTSFGHELGGFYLGATSWIGLAF